jgi:hypothetical protein
MIWKGIVLYASSMVVALYTTFVLKFLWAWFVVPAFHITEISFWVMYGTTLLIGLLRQDDHNNDMWQEHRHAILARMLLACVPSEKMHDVMAELKEHEKSIWSKVKWHIFGQFAGSTITLGIGFVVHMVASI